MPLMNNHTLNIPGAVSNAVLLQGKLNICHGNAQSICARKGNKLDEVRNFLQNSKITVACFTESWLSTKNSNRSIAIPGFSVVRNDRTYARGGGILMYYSDQLCCRKVFGTELSFDSDDKTECLALEVRLRSEKFLLIAVYNPPENDCSQFLAAKLADFAVRYDNIALIGDFNTDLSMATRKQAQFDAVLQTFHLVSVGAEPTFFHRTGCSQLDLLITNSIEKVLRFSQISFPALSQHDIILASLNFDVTPVARIDTYRDYVNFNAAVLENAVHTVPWNIFYGTRDPNVLLDFFNHHIKSIHDQCIPLRTRSTCKPANIWFNQEVRKSMLERDLAYRDWLTAPSEMKNQARRIYKILRNRTNTLIKNSKTRFLNQFLDDGTTSKALWKRLKTIGVGREKTHPDCDFDPDEVNRMFLLNYSVSEPQRRTGNSLSVSPYSFSFRTVHDWEVVNAVWDIKSGATGLDELPINFIKIILPLVSAQITHFFNCILDTSVYPSGWKQAKVLPLRKKTHINTMTNLRPISILSALSKVFEKLLKQQMSAFIAENKLLSEQQAGFRKGHGIKTAAVRVYDDLATKIDKRGSAILVLLDFSKAFDTIPHSKLCSKLETQFCFSSSAVDLMESYLAGRTQTVCCGEERSESGAVTSGVPQGSVIGPLLFCCYINDLPTVLKSCSIQMYADDVQLYVDRLGTSARELVEIMNAELVRVAEWSERNKLVVNQSKSKAMFVRGRRRNIVDANTIPAIAMNGQRIEWTEKALNLGFVFRADLQWDELVNQQCGKIYAALRTLYNCTYAAPVNTRLKLFKSLVLPHFLFGDVLHIVPSAISMNRLRVALNSCVRYVYGLDRYARVTHLQKNLLGCPLANFFAYRCCMFLMKLLRTRSPPALFQKLTPSQAHRLQNLLIPSNSTTSYASSLFVRGVVYWNTLPVALKRLTPEASFKRGCLEFWNER